MSDRTELGLLLQNLRLRQGESLSHMAEQLGMTRSYLSAIELGKRRAPVEFGDKVASTYDLAREERERLYRTSARNQDDDLKRRVLTSVILSALTNYGEDFLLGLGADIVREEGETGPIPTEVAIGLADSCDDNGGRLVRLQQDEVDLLSRLLGEEIDSLRSEVASDAPDDMAFEMWLELRDYNVRGLRWCMSLYQKLSGRAYVPDDECDDDEET